MAKDDLSPTEMSLKRRWDEALAVDPTMFTLAVVLFIMIFG